MRDERGKTRVAVGSFCNLPFGGSRRGLVGSFCHLSVVQEEWRGEPRGMEILWARGMSGWVPRIHAAMLGI